MIDPKLLRQLVKLMVDNDLSEVDLADGQEKIKLKRGQSGVPYVASPLPAPGGVAPAPAAAPPAAATAGEAPVSTDSESEDAITIDSPMVGTYYAASSPDAKPFVGVGDRVGPDTVVCIVEAMKVFNEIKAETTGTIKKVLVETGAAVEFGQPLYEIEPA